MIRSEIEAYSRVKTLEDIVRMKESMSAEDHFDGILKTTLSPQGFSKRIGIHAIQSISQDALLSRHWSINSRTIIYVLSGDGQVQVVSNNDVNLQSGEVVVVGKKQKVRWIVFWIIHASKEVQGRPAQRELLKHRDYEVGLDCCLGKTQNREDYFNICKMLYAASVTGDWEAAKNILDRHPKRSAIFQRYEVVKYLYDKSNIGSNCWNPKDHQSALKICVGCDYFGK
ncbi:11S globulin precursor [Tanacetum coccineum]